METFTRWLLEIVILIGLLAIAVGVDQLTSAPTLLVGLVLAAFIVLAHVAFDHYTQQEDL